MQVTAARRYGYHGLFDPELVRDMADPVRRSILLHSTKIELFEEILLGILQEQYPEVFKNLLDIHGTMIARSNGAKIEHIFKPTSKKKGGGSIQQSFVLPGGEVVHVIED